MQGILMKPHMIQATVEGRNTNTRRADASLREINKEPDEWIYRGMPYGIAQFDRKRSNERITIKPRYHVGETVYIKEKALYWVSPILEGVEYEKPSDWWSDCVYQDDPEIPALLADNGRLAMERSINQIVEGNSIIGKWEWKSPLHMPEHYGRHFIFIEAVRAERLQEITEDGAKAEGTLSLTGTGHRQGFSMLWDSINPKYPWDSNPWVWAYQFRLEMPSPSTGIVAVLMA